jgi:hypothetical protein
MRDKIKVSHNQSYLIKVEQLIKKQPQKKLTKNWALKKNFYKE